MKQAKRGCQESSLTVCQVVARTAKSKHWHKDLCDLCEKCHHFNLAPAVNGF